MANDIDVCNMALRYVGQGAVTIVALSPANPDAVETDACALWLPKARDELLEDHPWTFATKRAALTVIDQTDVDDDDLVRPEWAFMYELPLDCMGAIAVLAPGACEDAPTQKFVRELQSFAAQTFTADATTNLFTAVGHQLPDEAALTFATNGGVLPAEITAGSTYYANPASDDTFGVSATPGGADINLSTAGSGSPTFTRSDAEVIFTNIEDAIVRYNAAVTDPAKWPPGYQRTLALLLASYLVTEFAQGLEGAKVADAFRMRAMQSMRRAAAKNAQQQKTNPRDELPSWIKCRSGGWPDPRRQPGRIEYP